jgi:hypothetical protein
MTDPADASDIHAMLQHLQPADPEEIGGFYSIWFWVGRPGTADRFSLVKHDGKRAREVLRLHTEPGDATAEVLRVLDHDLSLHVTYASPRDPQGGFCAWRRLRSLSACHQKLLPRYRRRVSEQRRLIAGTLKRGRRLFGCLPSEGNDGWTTTAE